MENKHIARIGYHDERKHTKLSSFDVYVLPTKK